MVRVRGFLTIGLLAPAIGLLLTGCGVGTHALAEATGPTTTARAVTPPVSVIISHLRAQLRHPLLRPGEACPITLADPPPSRVPTALRAVLRGDLRGAYGRGPVWVLLPSKAPNSSRDSSGWLLAKVAWWIDVPGALQIQARRIDRRVATFGHLVTNDALYAANRMEPSYVAVPIQGCWEVAGGVGRNVITWIFQAGPYPGQ
ncbi:MAG: hypothetical protein ACR2L9_01475 [Solirubrobacteraceae bacterium]